MRSGRLPDCRIHWKVRDHPFVSLQRMRIQADDMDLWADIKKHIQIQISRLGETIMDSPSRIIHSLASVEYWRICTLPLLDLFSSQFNYCLTDSSTAHFYLHYICIKHGLQSLFGQSTEGDLTRRAAISKHRITSVPCKKGLALAVSHTPWIQLCNNQWRLFPIYRTKQIKSTNDAEASVSPCQSQSPKSICCNRLHLKYSTRRTDRTRSGDHFGNKQRLVEFMYAQTQK